jgi:multidrug efflux pump subunit AcrA (membrane-fusion protein)
MSKIKKITIIIAAAVAALATYQAWRTISKRGAKAEVRNLVPVEIMVVKAEDFDQTISLTGTVAAENQIDVPAKVPGKIISYLYQEGAWVDKKSTVVTIDRDEVGVEFQEAVVEAPISGWLTKRYYDTGTHVSPGMPLFQLADYRRVKLEASVPESDISKVRPGASATVTIDAWPDQSFSGSVKRVSPTVDYLSRTVRAEIALSNAGLKLRPGMYGRAEIKVKRHPQAIIVPSSAILERDDGRKVFVVGGGRAWSRRVESALDLGDRTVLASGVSAGDSLIVAGQHSVSDSSMVERVGVR